MNGPTDSETDKQTDRQTDRDTTLTQYASSQRVSSVARDG